MKNIGDVIGWEDDYNTVGPVAFAAKQFFWRLIPHILPEESGETCLYRLVLEYGDYGIHNMSITKDTSGQPLITSLFDWETGCIVPALLSDPEMAVHMDLNVDEEGAPTFYRLHGDETTEYLATAMDWAQQYVKVLFEEAPNYEEVIKSGKYARHLWFALRAWRGNDPEEYFGNLRAWAAMRRKESGVH